MPNYQFREADEDQRNTMQGIRDAFEKLEYLLEALTPACRERRRSLNAGGAIETAGDLNYVLTSVVFDWLMRRPESYDNYNTVIGVLESMKLEMYRKTVAIYEDLKESQNGAIFSE